MPRTSVSSVRPCHNTRNICEFCNTSIPSPEISGSSLRLLYPYPESTNPTEHNLAKSFVRSCCLDIACALASRCHCSSSVCLARRVGTSPFLAGWPSLLPQLDCASVLVLHLDHSLLFSTRILWPVVLEKNVRILL